ncbi:TrkA C-terminal domain-containing protein [Clostridiaceae bacterium HSG29]|nr:TrkA C-terminal domain-containing protein [Clostridiaceae bacterium HSG29]
MKKQSRYQEIAIDLATLIINGHYEEGDKIPGSSSLATKYQVSSETIRKAFLILKEYGVVTSTQKNGIEIVNTKNAILFLDKNQEQTTFTSIRNQIDNAIESRMKLNKEISQLTFELVNQISSQRDIGIIHPMEIMIKDSSPLIGKTLNECEFWNFTKSTIIALKKEQIQCISPSPNTILKSGDTLVFVGKSNTYSKMIKYVNTGKGKKTDM